MPPLRDVDPELVARYADEMEETEEEIEEVTASAVFTEKMKQE